MKNLIILFFLFLLVSFDYPRVPMQNYSPGDICTMSDPDFKEYRYPERIVYCRRNVSKQTKTQIYNLYNIPKEDRGDYIIDHIIPLSIGGSNSKENLWPEHYSIRDRLNPVEYELFTELREGRIYQSEAINTMLRYKFNLD